MTVAMLDEYGQNKLPMQVYDEAVFTKHAESFSITIFNCLQPR
ncbi:MULTISPECIES: hypothetical protein [Lysinibacillus]|nr:MULTISPECIES: hypothetical protein [Lysinibacillus]